MTVSPATSREMARKGYDLSGTELTAVGRKWIGQDVMLWMRLVLAVSETVSVGAQVGSSREQYDSSSPRQQSLLVSVSSPGGRVT
ncbi:hypothetical protein ElyMa_001460600 [Elysia marginata]|uniref:Uncharacterized protein n=1 Tax=Elysia marginata TaxID=1093978 RepID=A0AAV4IZR1_9GAST|nr:hypothetical protein ElyMa_001460600 [Elysia marginata]